MFEAYKVGIKLTVIDEFSKGIFLASTAFRTLDIQVLQLQKRLDLFRKFSFGFGGLSAGLGVGLAVPIIDAISKAAQLQKQMIGIQIATRGTTDQMDAMRRTMEKASSTTVFSTSQVGDIAKVIATSTSFSAPKVTSLLPIFAKFADIQYLLKGTDYNTSTQEAVRLAHTAKMYTPEALSSYLDTLTKASILSSGNISELGTALKYSQGTASTALGVSPQNMVLLTALANRLGFAGSRGGTNLIDAMIRTVPGIFGSGLLRGKSNEALKAMGMVDSKGHSLFFTNGKFDSMKWMQGMSAYVGREFASHPEAVARQDILTNFQHAFGAQGRRIATLFADPQALQQFQIMDKQFQQLASTGAMQDMFVKGSVFQQYATAKTNFQNAIIEFGWQLLPTATEALNKFNAGITKLTDWMQTNQSEVREMGEALVKISAGLIIVGGLGLLAAAFTALLTPVGLVVVALATLTKIFYDFYKTLSFLDSDPVQKAADSNAKSKHPYAYWAGRTAEGFGYLVDKTSPIHLITQKGMIAPFIMRHVEDLFYKLDPTNPSSRMSLLSNAPGSSQQAAPVQGVIYLGPHQVGNFVFGGAMDHALNAQSLSSLNRINASMSPMPHDGVAPY